MAGHTVNNFLQVATALFQHPKHNPVEIDHNQQIKFVYHGETCFPVVQK